MFDGPQDPDLISATSIDLLLDSRSKGLKYGLMRRLFDPFPQPVTYFGQHPRWLKRDVLAWLERQIKRPNGAAANVSAPGRSQNQLISISEAKARYEGGHTLDQLCREYQIGKARLLRLLREAGTAIRSPGKRSNGMRQVGNHSPAGGSPRVPDQARHPI